MHATMGNSLWGLILKSDVMSKGILITLLITSIMCWTVIFYKIIMFSMKQKQLENAMKKMQHVTSLDQLVTLAHQEEKTIAGHIITHQLNAAKDSLKRSNKKQLSQFDVSLLEDQRAATIEHLLYIDNGYLSFVITAAQASPLCGLLGTVWGLMHAFVSISHKQSADIVTVAPGIAEALLTTTAGLVVALPALVMFSYLKSRVITLEYCMITLSDAIQKVITHALLEVKE